MAASPQRPEHIGSVGSGHCGAARRRVTSAVDTQQPMRPHGARSARRYRIPARRRARPARALSDHHTANRPDQPGRGHPPDTEVIRARVHGRTQAPSRGNVHLAGDCFCDPVLPRPDDPLGDGPHAARAQAARDDRSPGMQSSRDGRGWPRLHHSVFGRRRKRPSEPTQPEACARSFA